jgi:hypothetical protein
LGDECWQKLLQLYVRNAKLYSAGWHASACTDRAATFIMQAMDMLGTGVVSASEPEKGA